MEPEKKTNFNITWTWADMISTYRFWGIALFYILLCFTYLLVNMLDFPNRGASLELNEMRFNPTMQKITALIGFFIGWLMIYKKKRSPLFLYSSITFIGLILVCFDQSLVVFNIGEILVAIGFGAVFLTIPAIISAGRGDNETFYVCFGITLLLYVCLSSSKTFLGGQILKNIRDSNQTLILLGFVSTLIGTILLLPVKPDLFYGSPPIREFSFLPKQRNPVTIAFSCLIPFYFIYVSYRYHGEVNSVSPCRELLSPRAATCFILFLPFLFPVIANSLNRSLLSQTPDNSLSKFHKLSSILFWSFLWPPISMALIQSNMNKLITKHE